MISVLLATYNRQHILPLTLEAFTKLIIPEQGVEFIIVDNASTDQTAEIIRTYQKSLPIHYCYEGRQGKAIAIHTGITKATGELIVFTDDDVVPEPHWLMAIAESADTLPDYAVFLGQVRPFWMRPPPAWLQRLTDEGRSCGCTPLEREDGAVSFIAARGTNMTVRAEVLAGASFREDLWIAGHHEVGGEDTDFVRKASEIGFKLWFSKQISLKHIIRPEEMKIRSVWRRYFRIGRSIEAITPIENSYKKTFGYPRWMLSMIVKRSLACLWYLFRFQQYQAASELVNIAILCGKAYQVKKQ